MGHSIALRPDIDNNSSTRFLQDSFGYKRNTLACINTAGVIPLRFINCREPSKVRMEPLIMRGLMKK